MPLPCSVSSQTWRILGFKDIWLHNEDQDNAVVVWIKSRKRKPLKRSWIFDKLVLQYGWPTSWPTCKYFEALNVWCLGLLSCAMGVLKFISFLGVMASSECDYNKCHNRVWQCILFLFDWCIKPHSRIFHFIQVSFLPPRAGHHGISKIFLSASENTNQIN